MDGIRHLTSNADGCLGILQPPQHTEQWAASVDGPDFLAVTLGRRGDIVRRTVDRTTVHLGRSNGWYGPVDLSAVRLHDFVEMTRHWNADSTARNNMIYFRSLVCGCLQPARIRGVHGG